MLDALKASANNQGDAYPDEFDLLIVGGGATGAGVAVDAASRGLKVALVERDDFSAGTFTPVQQRFRNLRVHMVISGISGSYTSIGLWVHVHRDVTASVSGSYGDAMHTVPRA